MAIVFDLSTPTGLMYSEKLSSQLTNINAKKPTAKRNLVTQDVNDATLLAAYLLGLPDVDFSAGGICVDSQTAQAHPIYSAIKCTSVSIKPWSIINGHDIKDRATAQYYSVNATYSQPDSSAGGGGGGGDDGEAMSDEAFESTFNIYPEVLEVEGGVFEWLNAEGKPDSPAQKSYMPIQKKIYSGQIVIPAFGIPELSRIIPLIGTINQEPFLGMANASLPIGTVLFTGVSTTFRSTARTNFESGMRKLEYNFEFKYTKDTVAGTCGWNHLFNPQVMGWRKTSPLLYEEADFKPLEIKDVGAN